MHLLDSSAIIELIKGTKKGDQIRSFLKGKIAMTTSLTVQEILSGAKNNELAFLEMFFNNMQIFNFDYTAAKQGASIERKLRDDGLTINKFDILIAAICLANDIGIITLDNHFNRIKKLKVKFIEH